MYSYCLACENPYTTGDQRPAVAVDVDQDHKRFFGEPLNYRKPSLLAQMGMPGSSLAG